MSCLQAAQGSPDSLELVKLYNAANGPNWTVTWNLNEPITTWSGVTASNGAVLELNLAGANLAGYLPTLQLPSLEYLNLSNNALSGEIPNLQMPQLETLTLAGNQLAGDIPNFNLPELRYLDLSDNQLMGTLPALNLPKIIQFKVSKNRLTGIVPAFNFPICEFLLMSENQFTGPIPAFQIPKIVSLDLSINQLSGEIPAFDYPFLVFLNLGNNAFSGPIPDFTTQVLQYLSLENNQLEGNIPNFTSPNLQIIFLQNNRLTGPCPTIASTNLVLFSAYNNFITGPISNLLSLPGTTVIRIFNNNLTFSDIAPLVAHFPTITYAPQRSFGQDAVYYGPAGTSVTIDLQIDPAIGNSNYYWRKDSVLWVPPAGNDIHSNTMTISSLAKQDASRYFTAVTNPDAPILTLFSHTYSLRVCDADSDSLQLVGLYNATGGPAWTNSSGWIMPGVPIGSWHGIATDAFGCVRKIDLRANGLSGTLPALDLNTLDTLILADNALSATLPELQIPFVKYLDLSGNDFTGAFPNAMKTWDDLQTLNVANNGLQGPIPPDLGDLCELTELRLNNNAIEGELPEELTMLYNLQIGKVDFSNNQIDSLKQKIIFFCPFGDGILSANPSYDRFLGICNIQCAGTEWDTPGDFPWIGDTLAALPCSGSGCEASLAQAGFVIVRGVRTVFTRTRCFTEIGPPSKFEESVRFFDCGGHPLENVSCNENQFCTQFGAISKEEYDNLAFDIRWSCGQDLLPVPVNEPEETRPFGTNLPRIPLIFSPNPTSTRAVAAVEKAELILEITVSDIFGKKHQLPGIQIPGEISLDVSQLPKGIYFVTARTKNKLYVGKIVVE